MPTVPTSKHIAKENFPFLILFFPSIFNVLIKCLHKEAGCEVSSSQIKPPGFESLLISYYLCDTRQTSYTFNASVFSSADEIHRVAMRIKSDNTKINLAWL